MSFLLLFTLNLKQPQAIMPIISVQQMIYLIYHAGYKQLKRTEF